MSTLLNKPSTVALNRMEQKHLIEDLYILPTINEVKKAIKQTRSENAPGMGGKMAVSLHSSFIDHGVHFENSP